MDKSTILSIRLQDMSDKRIKAARLKTKAKVRLYAWTDELKECAAEIKALPRPIGSMWLFCTRKGPLYINDAGYTSGFDSLWKRFMTKALANAGLKERFTDHDLRAKAASDVESLQFAKSLLGYADESITRRVYRRKIEVVKTRRIGKISSKNGPE